MRMCHFLVPAAHLQNTHVPVAAGNHGQMPVNFQFGHPFPDSPFDFGKAGVRNGDGFLNLSNFIG
jgi:hypothetical protein